MSCRLQRRASYKPLNFVNSKQPISRRRESRAIGSVGGQLGQRIRIEELHDIAPAHGLERL
jgi:hypothetical protein